MRNPNSIDLKKPAIGLLLTHSYHQGKSRVVSDFRRSSNLAAFRNWFWSQPSQAGCELLDDDSRRSIFKNALKGSNFTRFMLSQDKTLFGYSLDINWTNQNGEWQSVGAKHYGWCKYVLFNQNPEKHLLNAVCASEICQTGRPARMIFDLDGTPGSVGDGTKDDFLEEFCCLLIGYFEKYLKIKLSREEICCDPRSCQKDKWSYHVIVPGYWVSCWKNDMPHVLRGILKLDQKDWFGDNTLDFSLYGAWKVIGCVLSTKWK